MIVEQKWLARPAGKQAEDHRASCGDNKNGREEAAEPVRCGERIERGRLDLQRLAFLHRERGYTIRGRYGSSSQHGIKYSDATDGGVPLRGSAFLVPNTSVNRVKILSRMT